MFNSGKDDKHLDKKAKVQKRNRKHQLINQHAWQHENEALKMQEESGLHLDADRIGEESEEEKRKRLEGKLSTVQARLQAGKLKAMKKWSVANTSSGAFHVR